MQPLKLATSNLVHNLGWDYLTKKQRFGPKLAGVWARGAAKKIGYPLRIFATVKASSFKFGTVTMAPGRAVAIAGINSKVDVCEKAKHHTELFW